MVSPHQDMILRTTPSAVNGLNLCAGVVTLLGLRNTLVVDGMASLPCPRWTYGSMGYRKSGYVVTLLVVDGL